MPGPFYGRRASGFPLLRGTIGRNLERTAPVCPHRAPARPAPAGRAWPVSGARASADAVRGGRGRQRTRRSRPATIRPAMRYTTAAIA